MKYQCAGCGAFVDTVDQAMTHCKNPKMSSHHASHTVDPDSSPDVENPSGATSSEHSGKNAKRIHDNRFRDGQRAATSRTPRTECSKRGCWEPVAFHEDGKPCILRQVDLQTGVGHTVVVELDGTCHTFGQTSLMSTLKSTEEELVVWLDALEDLLLRGLVHELGQTLLEGSHKLKALQKERKKFERQANLDFFGLSADATEKEIDNSYRKMARILHPDKNGGTEAANSRFQDMKLRYEALKAPNEKGEEEPLRGAPDEPIKYDPCDQMNLKNTARRMLVEYKNLQVHMESLRSKGLY